jgi:hypothetical protein
MQRRVGAFVLVVIVGCLATIGVTRGRPRPAPPTVTQLLRDTNDPALHRSLVFQQQDGSVAASPADFEDRGVTSEPLRFVTHSRSSWDVFVICDGGFAGRTPAAQLSCGLPDAIVNQRCSPPIHDDTPEAERLRSVCTATIPAGVRVYRLLHPAGRQPRIGPSSLPARPWTTLYWFRDRRLLFETWTAPAIYANYVPGCVMRPISQGSPALAELRVRNGCQR